MYKNRFPVAFSEDGRKEHLTLSEKDYEKLSNKAGQKYKDADSHRIHHLLEDLGKIRIAQNSTGGEIRIYSRSLNTGKSLLKTIHPRIRNSNFVEVIGLSHPKQNWKNFPWPRVQISKNGVMSPDDRKLLTSELDKKVLVMLSGGEGRSDQPFYRPITRLMQKLLDEHIYTWAVCMSYQVLADQVLHLGIKKGQALPPPQEGRFHVGTQVADLTEHGKADPVFGELAPAFGVESFNHFRIYGANTKTNATKKNIKILARDKASNEVVAFKVGETCWAIQYHPELKKVGRQGKGIQSRRSLSMNGNSIIMPKGTHPYQEGLMKRLAKSTYMQETYHMTVEDFQQFFHPARRVHNVGDQIALNVLEQAVAAKKRELEVA